MKKLATDHCSLTTGLLPARLDDAWNLAFERQRAETQAANAKLAQKTARSPAELAPIVLAAAELRLPRVFHSFCSGCHKSSSKAANSFQLSAFSSLLTGYVREQELLEFSSPPASPQTN